FFGQCRNRLDLGEGAFRGVPGVCRYRRCNLIAVVGKTATGMKREVARTAAGGRFCERGFVGSERTFRWVEFIDQELVEAEVGGDGEAIAGRDVDRVSVRAGFALLINARAFVLEGARRFLQRTI